MEWMEKIYIFGSYTETAAHLNATIKVIPCSLCPREWRIGEIWAFFSALLPSGRVSSKSWSWQTFSGWEPFLQASQIPYPWVAFLSCMSCSSSHCIVELAYTLPTSHGERPAVPMTLKQVPLCKADALILAQANKSKLHTIERIPMYLGFEDPGDIIKASADTVLNRGLHPFIQIAVILCLWHARHGAAYYW